MTPESTPFRLTRLRIKNFRSIREADIPLGPLTVLVGPNGSGKSNVLDALRFMRDISSGLLPEVIGERKGFGAVRKWAEFDAENVALGIEMSSSAGSVSYSFELAAKGKAGAQVVREELALEPVGLPRASLIRAKGVQSLYFIGKEYKYPRRERWPNNDVMSIGVGSDIINEFDVVQDYWDSLNPNGEWSFYEQLGSKAHFSLQEMSFFNTDVSALRLPQNAMDLDHLMENGHNLASVLRAIKRESQIAWADVKLFMARLLGEVIDASIVKTGSFLVTYLHYATASGKVRKSDLGQESDGTLRALNILAALYQKKTQPCLAFEEPETAIHPGMLAVLAELFVVISDHKQILLTTHSPDLLDYLPPESFLVVEKVNGETLVGPLADYQRETIRQKLFTPGEILRSEGLHRDEPLPTE